MKEIDLNKLYTPLITDGIANYALGKRDIKEGLRVYFGFDALEISIHMEVKKNTHNEFYAENEFLQASIELDDKSKNYKVAHLFAKQDYKIGSIYTPNLRKGPVFVGKSVKLFTGNEFIDLIVGKTNDGFKYAFNDTYKVSLHQTNDGWVATSISDMKCSNRLCNISLNEELDEIYHNGTSSGYSDDYSFCMSCGIIADKNFDIAHYHSGGMISEPPCNGGNQDKNGKVIEHICPFSQKQREEAYAAFKNYH